MNEEEGDGDPLAQRSSEYEPEGTLTKGLHPDLLNNNSEMFISGADMSSRDKWEFPHKLKWPRLSSPVSEKSSGAEDSADQPKDWSDKALLEQFGIKECRVLLNRNDVLSGIAQNEVSTKSLTNPTKSTSNIQNEEKMKRRMFKKYKRRRNIQEKHACLKECRVVLERLDPAYIGSITGLELCNSNPLNTIVKNEVSKLSIHSSKSSGKLKRKIIEKTNTHDSPDNSYSDDCSASLLKYTRKEQSSSVLSQTKSSKDSWTEDTNYIDSSDEDMLKFVNRYRALACENRPPKRGFPVIIALKPSSPKLKKRAKSESDKKPLQTSVATEQTSSNADQLCKIKDCRVLLEKINLPVKVSQDEHWSHWRIGINMGVSPLKVLVESRPSSLVSFF